MVRLVLLLAVLILAGCTNADQATRLLKAQGFTDIHITGYRYFGCSEDDTYHTGFEAESISGEPVSGIVCAGWWHKGATIRFD